MPITYKISRARSMSNGRIQTAITEAAKTVLGMSKVRRKCDKEIWRWKVTIQKEIKLKDAHFKRWQASKSLEKLRCIGIELPNVSLIEGVDSCKG